VIFKLILNNPNCFFVPVFIPELRKKLFNRGQFGLTPVNSIFYPSSLGCDMLPVLPFLSNLENRLIFAKYRTPQLHLNKKFNEKVPGLVYSVSPVQFTGANGAEEK